MYSFDFQNTDLRQIKDILDLSGFDRFTLIPTSRTTKVLILDRNNQQSENIKNLIKDYGQPKVYQGTANILRQSEYAEVSARYQEVHRADAGRGTGNRSDQRSGQIGNHDQLDASGGLLARLEARRDTLKSSLVVDCADYKMVEIATAFIGFNREGSNSFAAQDIVAISGTMPGEASLIQMKAEFEQKYLPLLEEAIAAKSTFVLENRSGINKLMATFLNNPIWDSFQQYSLKSLSLVGQTLSLYPLLSFRESSHQAIASLNCQVNSYRLRCSFYAWVTLRVLKIRVIA
jgi:hypothetical protein